MTKKEIEAKMDREFRERQREAEIAQENGAKHMMAIDILMDMLKNSMLLCRAEYIDRKEYNIRRNWIEKQVI